MRLDADRVGILSDTHGVLNDDVLLTLRGCGLILHAGDIGGAGILDHLRRDTGSEVLAVAGNNDTRAKWHAAEHRVLARLDETLRVELPGGLIVMEHGHRIWDTRNYHRRLRRKHADAKMIVYGHTHVRVVDTSESPWVVNPGAAGRERTKHGPSCLVIDTTGADWFIQEHCFPKPARRTG